MPGDAYECAECKHVFRTPDGAPHDTRSLMCPACGCIDLTIVDIERPQPPMIRSRTGAPAGDWREPRETSTS